MAAATLGTSCTPGTDAEIQYHANAVAIEVGQDVYIDAADGERLKLASTASLATSNVHGIAISKANVANQRVGVVTNGPVENCASGTEGQFLHVSDTPGSLCPEADLGPGDFGASVGYRATATIFIVKKVITGVAHG